MFYNIRNIEMFYYFLVIKSITIKLHNRIKLKIIWKSVVFNKNLKSVVKFINPILIVHLYYITKTI
jgi:hypothetical protein